MEHEEARSMVITKCIEVAGGGRMNREEAAEFTRKLVARAETIVFPKIPKTINNIPVFYFEAVLSALRGPQPDPETGLVRCGCGGKAILFHQPDIEGPGSDGDRWAVFCEKFCGMETSDMTSPEDAVETWNTAMSGGMCNHEN